MHHYVTMTSHTFPELSFGNVDLQTQTAKIFAAWIANLAFHSPGLMVSKVPNNALPIWPVSRQLSPEFV